MLKLTDAIKRHAGFISRGRAARDLANRYRDERHTVANAGMRALARAGLNADEAARSLQEAMAMARRDGISDEEVAAATGVLEKKPDKVSALPKFRKIRIGG